MFNIHLKGNYEKESQLIEGKTLREDAIPFEEPDTIQEVFKQGCKYMMPLLIVIGMLAGIRFGLLDFRITFNFHLVYVICLGIVFTYPLLYIHEFIHALFFPIHANKSIWKIPKDGAFFVYCDEFISKKRFIVMSGAPLVILGIFPFVVWLFVAPLISSNATIIFLLVSISMIVGAVGDVANIVNAYKQVDKDGYVFNYGMHSYWVKKK